MATISSGLNANIPPQQKNVSQVYLDVTLKTITQGAHLHVGVPCRGTLTMEEFHERFLFKALDPARWARNPRVFQGKFINIHRDKQGHLRIQMRKLVLDKSFNPVRLGYAIIKELSTAKKLLEL